MGRFAEKKNKASEAQVGSEYCCISRWGDGVGGRAYTKNSKNTESHGSDLVGGLNSKQVK